MPNLDIRVVAHNSSEYEETIALRSDILRKPLGLVFTPEQLGAERSDYHIACYDNERLVGCLVLTPLDDVGEPSMKMRQVAVAEGVQGRGVGRAMVEFSESLACEHGFNTIVLNARESAAPFYERLDYRRVGERFKEVGIPHWKMVKRLVQ